MTFHSVKRNPKTELIDVGIAFFVFLHLFRPPLIRVDFTYLAIVLDIIIIVFFSRRTIAIKKGEKSVIRGFIPFMVFFLFNEVFHIFTVPGSREQFVLAIVNHLKTLIYIVFTTFAMKAIVEKQHISAQRFTRIIALSGLMQFGCVALAFIVPAVKSLFLKLIYSNLKSEIMVEAIKGQESYRCYGLSDNLFDSFGYISALIITVLYANGIKEKKPRYIVIAIMLMIMPLLNARTGIVLGLVGIIVATLQNFKFRKVIKYLIGFAVICVIVVLIYDKLPSGLREWLDIGINSTIGLFRGERESAYAEILVTDMVFPPNLLLGAGAAPEFITNMSDSIDSGYIQCIWRYGLIGTILLFFGFINMLIRRKEFRRFGLPIFALLVIYLFKIYGVFNYGSLLLVITFPILIDYLNQQNETGLESLIDI